MGAPGPTLQDGRWVLDAVGVRVIRTREGHSDLIYTTASEGVIGDARSKGPCEKPNCPRLVGHRRRYE
jgi:hypothetical protein